MADNNNRKLMKRYGFVKTERIKDLRTGTVQDVIEGPLQEGGRGVIKMAPADQTKAGLRRQLMNRAFDLPAIAVDRDDLYEAIAESEALRVVQYAERNGWSDDGSYFVLQDRALGRAPKGQRGLHPDSTATLERLGVAGTLEAWKATVAAPVANSSAMLTAVAAAFATPLLTFLGAMPSLMGWPGKQVLRTWDMTEPAMDDLLSAANDLLTPIDDLMSLKAGGGAHSQAR